MYSEPIITPPTDSIVYKHVDNEHLASYQGLGRHRNWFYSTDRYWPEPPTLRDSGLLPVPQQDLFRLVHYRGHYCRY